MRHPLESVRLGSIVVRRLTLAAVTIAVFLTSSLALPQAASAYPIFAQQAYENPREATGRIVCANCHLAAKPTEVEVPQSVLPDTVFEAVVKIPYDTNVQQVIGDGSKGPLNVGAVLMLPEGFQLAPEDRIPEELKEKVEDLYFQPYSDAHPNWVVIGPLPGEQYQEIAFPVLSPDPKTDKAQRFGKYAVHVGGNRGRGQVYPTGEKSNNAIYNASADGTISQIAKPEDGGYEVTIQTADGKTVVDTIPAGPDLLVSEGQDVKAGDALTVNPNVGGFGQADAEIVLQNPDRIKGLLAFFGIVTLSQIMLVLKKKQVERVQAAEMNF
ncbi:apocytochrome f [Leptolyngbya sp. FACHB-36]|uniref:cytochrome f n=1 Tax=Leptolyngbya sp. FACHB-36 TaxID=2692808 RepID=UPI0016809543|nr:apocytochrome f [Leptolyngbya sp. FACHB-36]MBD2018966.1 apocytochrome f [Leptolyngbya sp. FACHB-36]